jgi:UDP-N-acetylmuramoylalanine--D-glutamate ligase
VPTQAPSIPLSTAFLNHSRYGVLGAGKSGQGAARLLHGLQGAPRHVTLFDDKMNPADPALQALAAEGIAIRTGEVVRELADLQALVVSPGIPAAHPLLTAARAAALPILGELELAWLLAGDAKFCAITGTNGKTTTTEIIYRMLTDAARPALAAGNIGYALADAVREHAPELDTLTFSLEVSSFQLEATEQFAPAVALILNITPDHLDRYEHSMELYAAAKERITLHQRPDQVLVINQDDPACMAVAARTAARVRRFSLERPVDDGAWLDGDLIYLVEPGRKPKRLLAMDELQMVGIHNVANAMAAAVAADSLGLSRDQIAATLKAFKAAPHRMEPVGEKHGVLFINDSKATNLDAMARAIESFPQGIHLIAGGRDKASPFAQFTARMLGRVRTIYLIGEAASDMHAAWSGDLECLHAGTLENALTLATARATEGEVIMLSPACASFDQFNSYAHRGETFTAWVQTYLQS